MLIRSLLIAGEVVHGLWPAPVPIINKEKNGGGKANGRFQTFPNGWRKGMVAMIQNGCKMMY